jgi:hypothetical protein
MNAFSLRRCAAVFAIAAGTSIGAGPAVAQQPNPIVITNCSIIQWVPRAGFQYWGPFDFPSVRLDQPVADGLSITYRNESALTADRVAFDVVYRGKAERVIDIGVFSPGITIDHTFANFSGIAYLGPRPEQCRTRAVRFTDGSVWRRPGLPAPAAHPYQQQSK